LKAESIVSIQKTARNRDENQTEVIDEDNLPGRTGRRDMTEKNELEVLEIRKDLKIATNHSPHNEVRRHFL
jgi:hypothetical protein